MLPIDQRERQDRRIAGEAVDPQAKVPSYQELLDQALDDTFPASDPIATSAALHVHEPHTTPRDCHDWTLKPGACPPVGQPCDDGAGSPRSRRCAAELSQALEVGGRRLPAGPCELEQSTDTATLRWREGRRWRRQAIDVETLRSLLASGQLRRGDRSECLGAGMPAQEAAR
jgi:hypothetical protein